jgi:hypothetical protein
MKRTTKINKTRAKKTRIKKTRKLAAAVITIHRVPDMTPGGRRQIAAWMRKQADYLIKDGKDYTKGRFTARYLHY